MVVGGCGERELLEMWLWPDWQRETHFLMLQHPKTIRWLLSGLSNSWSRAMWVYGGHKREWTPVSSVVWPVTKLCCCTALASSVRFFLYMFFSCIHNRLKFFKYKKKCCIVLVIGFSISSSVNSLLIVEFSDMCEYSHVIISLAYNALGESDQYAPPSVHLSIHPVVIIFMKLHNYSDQGQLIGSFWLGGGVLRGNAIPPGSP